MIFQVKRNAILVAIVLFLIILPFFLLFESESLPTLIIPFLLSAFLAHALIKSYFVIENQKLIIVFGLIKKEIQIRDMKEIRYSNNPLSAPAWTLKRLEIIFAKPIGTRPNADTRFALVSLPKDETGFFTEITKINPHLKTP
ncbi:PH domain-containing protein [Metabacillus idriensis]|uniref:PH domain-containing protein n=1 Tax=Metabacillus idriensis TaxID=324768 RepID=UPI003D2DE003